MVLAGGCGKNLPACIGVARLERVFHRNQLAVGQSGLRQVLGLEVLQHGKFPIVEVEVIDRCGRDEATGDGLMLAEIAYVHICSADD